MPQSNLAEARVVGVVEQSEEPTAEEETTAEDPKAAQNGRSEVDAALRSLGEPES